MIFPVLDIVSATIFMVCETFMIVMQLLGKLKHPTRRTDLMYTLAGIIAIASLMYLVGLRFLPYAWICIKGSI